MASKMNPGFMAMMAKKKGAKAGDKAAMPMKKGGGVKKMASGGYTSAADGIAKKGKTKGTQIAMQKGGKC